jgi:hypothetical protein
MIEVNCNGGQIGRIRWINSSQFGFGRVWWEGGSGQPKVTSTLPEWSPANLPGLTCWYCADDGVYVDSETGQQFLRDLSGNGRHLIVTDAVETSEAIIFNVEQQQTRFLMEEQ